MSFVPVVQVASDSLPRQPNVNLDHLRGPKGHWCFGNTRALLPDPAAFLIEMRARYGDCFTVGVLFNRRVVVLAGPAANRLVLLDPDRNFSSRMGWEVMLDFFGGFLLLRDFEDHRVHRRLMTDLFKPAALRRYLDSMHPIIRNAMAGFDSQPDAYRLARRLALDIGLQVFADFATAPRNEAVYLDTLRILDGVMASTMSMMMFSLARHRDWQRQVRAEILAHDRGAVPSFEQLGDMPVATAVLRETLRLFSPVQLLPRRNVRAFEFFDNHIPENSHILLAPQMCHRDPMLFERPESFRPDRFLVQVPESQVDPFSFIPFGKGSHMCMGMNFAMLAVKAFFAQLLRAFDIRLAAERTPDIRYLPTLRPTKRLPLRFVPIGAFPARGQRSLHRRSASDMARCRAQAAQAPPAPDFKL